MVVDIGRWERKQGMDNRGGDGFGSDFGVFLNFLYSVSLLLSFSVTCKTCKFSFAKDYRGRRTGMLYK